MNNSPIDEVFAHMDTVGQGEVKPEQLAYQLHLFRKEAIAALETDAGDEVLDELFDFF